MKIDEEFASVTYGYISYKDSFHFMGEKLQTLVKTLKEEDFILRRKVSGDRWNFVKRKMSYPSKAFKKFTDYDKPLTNLKESLLFICFK